MANPPLHAVPALLAEDPAVVAAATAAEKSPGAAAAAASGLGSMRASSGQRRPKIGRAHV